MDGIGTILMEWYRQNARTLPWRETCDPYRIWVSEIILQQTRIAQGLDYYRRFMERFPDVSSLAAASEDEVLKLWQGLGYYNRARNLHAAAKTVVTAYGGIFPASYPEVRALKGVGDYTAAAICSIAYGQPYAVVDGNVYRVLARLWDCDLPIDSGAGKKHFAALAQEQLDRQQPGIYNQAIMDFGAMQCTPGQPDCSVCPLSGLCQGRAAGHVLQLPVKSGKSASRTRYFHYLHLLCGDTTWLRRRAGKDIWQGLYEFPLVETDGPATWENLREDPRCTTLFTDCGETELLDTVSLPRHILSHQAIESCFYRIRIEYPSAEWTDYVAVESADIDSYAVSRLTESYLKRLKTEEVTYE